MSTTQNSMQDEYPSKELLQIYLRLEQAKMVDLRMSTLTVSLWLASLLVSLYETPTLLQSSPTFTIDITMKLVGLICSAILLRRNLTSPPLPYWGPQTKSTSQTQSPKTQ